MRVAQLMLIVMSGLALAGCPKKPQTLPGCQQPARADERRRPVGTTDTDVSGAWPIRTRR